MTLAQPATPTVEPSPAPKTEYEFHPLANIFPMMTGHELGVLAKGIRENGLRQKIITYDGKILDGRNRYRACGIAVVRPIFEELPPGQDPLAFVIDANLTRRHLNETQRGIVAAKLANMRRGGKEANPSIDGNALVSQATAAKLLNVSPKTVERSVKLITGGVPELVEAAGGAFYAALAERGIKVRQAKDNGAQPSLYLRPHVQQRQPTQGDWRVRFNGIVDALGPEAGPRLLVLGCVPRWGDDDRAEEAHAQRS